MESSNRTLPITATDPSEAGSSPVISLPTRTATPYAQTIIGRKALHVGDVEEFRGIPYGLVESRWTHSTPRTALPNDIFDATRNGPKCPQPPHSNNTLFYQSHLEFPVDVTESEFDCLNLFISRPDRNALLKLGLDTVKSPLPVYVYVHGGGYAAGAGTDPPWDPARLVSQSIKQRTPFIAVVVNYRLNIFGFAASKELLEAEENSSKGCNFGLLDQYTALKWVHANIKSFGGDHNRITLAGQSAGGTSVYAHVLRSLDAAGQRLFRAAVIQSPAAGILGPIDLEAADEKWANMCQYMRLDHVTVEDRLATLRAVSTAELLRVMADLGQGLFMLVQDEVSLSERMYNAVDPESDAVLVQANITEMLPPNDKETDLDILIGITDCEGSVFYHQVEQIDNFEQLLRIVGSTSAVETIRQFLGLYGILPSASKAEIQRALYTLLTDVLFLIPAHRAHQNLGRFAPGNEKAGQGITITDYYFNTGNPFPGRFRGMANHCVDLIYLYDCFHDALRGMDEFETKSARAMKSLGIPPSNKNEALVQDFQERMINFICSNKPRENFTFSSDKEAAVVFDPDRQTRVVDPYQDDGLREMHTRIEAVESLWDVAKSIALSVLKIPRESAHKEMVDASEGETSEDREESAGSNERKHM